MRLLVDKPAGVTSHDVVAAERRRLGRGVKVGHAGTLDPFATGLLLVLVGRATRVQRFLMALPKRYETVARLGLTSTTGDLEGEIAPGRMPAEPLALPTGRDAPAPAGLLGGEGRRQARLRAGPRAARRSSCPSARSTVHRFELLWRDGERAAFAIECCSGTYVRSLVADLGDAYCLELRRTAIGPFDVADAGRFIAARRGARASCRRSSSTARTRAAPAHGVAVPGRGARGAPCGCVDGDGLIALAEPRGTARSSPS